MSKLAKNAGKAAAGAVKKKLLMLLLVKIGLPVAIAAVPIVGIGGAMFAVVSTLSGGGGGDYAVSCTIDEELAGDGLTVRSAPGDEGTAQTVTLERQQLLYAAEIISVAQQQGVPFNGWKIALMTALVESRLLMYANDSVPESLDYAHDAVGSDHDSVGLFQQRPASGWGTVAELMNVSYSAQAFFGGPEGPNGGSPRGLLDVDGWETMTLGEAAQAVQVSAFPERYQVWDAASEDIIEAVLPLVQCEEGAGGAGTGKAALPLDPGFVLTSGFGPRDAPAANASTWHAGIDLLNPGSPCGKPVYAVQDGTVTFSSSLWLSIQHPDGYTISYLHMYESDHTVQVGDTVVAGQRIGAVGNAGSESGMSSGCHLDLRISVAGNTNPQIAQLQTVADLGGDAQWADYVNPIEFMKAIGAPLFVDAG